MKTDLACIPCILQQTIDTVELSSDDPEVKKQAVDKILSYLKTIDYKVPPPVLGKRVYEILNEITGNPDPYRDIKIRYNEISMGLYDDLRRIVLQNEDPINTAAKLAVAGNVIDFGVRNREVHVEQILDSIHTLSFSIDDFDLFINDLKKSKKIVYLADNAGEIVFDRLFVEMLQRFYPERGFNFTVVVRGAPIINDATMEDAEMIGLTDMANVISNGDNAPATDLLRVSPEMKKAYDAADIIISKGMGNYETLDLEDRLIYYLLKVKCPTIAKQISAEEGSLVFKRNADYKD